MAGLQTSDGCTLALHSWPARGRMRGTVQIVHGLGEHMDRYALLAARLNHAGWRVVGHDQRGHGRSGGPRGGLPGPNALLVDLAMAIDHLREPGPLVLLGHSLGGLVAARFVAEGLRGTTARWLRDVDGLVLSSPALDLGLTRLQQLQLGLLRRVAPGLAVGNRLDPAWICRDADVVQAYRDDPLVHDRITPALAHFMVEAGEFVRRRASHWRVPTLLMWAGDDRCVAPAGSAAFVAAAPAAVVSSRLFPGLQHEIFNEPEREYVLETLMRWLPRFDERAPDRAPGR